MNKSLPFFTGIAILICFLSNFTTESVRSFVFTAVSEEPVLPATPFEYSDITFPNHLFAGDSIDTGYGAGPIDTSTIANIDNNMATLGRVLFYDERLSALENISCSSCHIQEKSFADGVAFSEGISAPTKRNSMNLNDLGWSNNDHFFWDLSQTNLRQMIVLPLTDDNEIGANMDDVATKLLATSYYPELFQKAYGHQIINEESIVNALIQFINSMVTFESKFDKASKTNFQDFSQQELNGLELFSAHCTTCHSQGSHNPFGFFGNPADTFFLDMDILVMFPFIFNNGLAENENDLGAGEWDANLRNLFKIPTLRNIEVTGPYMHDGRFETLEDVLNHYSEDVESNDWDFGFIPPGGFQFSANEKSDLIAFLKTLTDASFLIDEKWANPFDIKDSTVEPLDLNFVIKPNPMLDQAIIEFDNQKNEIISINILSASGQLITSFKTTEGFFELDKNKFGTGLYFIEINKGQERALQKLIVN